MHVYLFGPEGPDQLASKWLLRERGYECVCASDVRSEAYAGEAPTEAQFRMRQLHEMQRADAVVVDEDALEHSGAMLHLLHVARFGGMAVLRYEDLPAQAPVLLRRDEIIAERDLVREEAPPVSARLRTQWRHAVLRMQGWARRFDARFAWFFTNGNKARALATYDQQAPVTTTA